MIARGSIISGPFWWILGLAITPWICLFILWTVFPQDKEDWRILLLLGAGVTMAVVTVPYLAFRAMKTRRWLLALSLFVAVGFSIYWIHHASSPSAFGARGIDLGDFFMVAVTGCLILISSVAIFLAARVFHVFLPIWRRFFDRSIGRTEVEPADRGEPPE